VNEFINLNKIGEGQDSEVYSLEDSKVLKLFRNPNDDRNAIREMEVLEQIYKAGINAPRVYEYVSILNRPGFTMDRIDGNSIMSIIEKKPYLILQVSKEFGRLHSEIHRLDNQVKIPSLKENLRNSIKAVNCLENELIECTLKLLSELPEGNSICHGDYNPANVILNSTNPVFLDWGGVSKGDATADVAHTLLILKNGQFPPNTSELFKFILKLGRKTFADIYFHTYQQYNPLDLSVLSKWEIVRAVGRLGYGGTEERPALLKFIRRFYENKNNDKIILF
jgi:uncharacterized protein (TIGR02172 family)